MARTLGPVTLHESMDSYHTMDSHHDTSSDQREALRSLAQQHDSIIWGDNTDSGESSTSNRTGIPGGALLAGDLGAKHGISSSMRALSVSQRRSGQRIRRGSSIPQAGLMIAATVVVIMLVALLALGALVWLVS